jgi:hypothetical protein
MSRKDMLLKYWKSLISLAVGWENIQLCRHRQQLSCNFCLFSERNHGCWEWISESNRQRTFSLDVFFTSRSMYASECGHWHKTASVFPQRSYFDTEFRKSLFFFISAPSTQQQSLPFLCFVLNRFLLSDLTRVRPLIYSADIACKPEHSTRNVDSAFVRQTAVNSIDTFPVSRDSSELRQNILSNIITLTYLMSHSSTSHT